MLRIKVLIMMVSEICEVCDSDVAVTVVDDVPLCRDCLIRSYGDTLRPKGDL